MSAYTHLSADFHGVDASRLRDASMLTGLLIAAAGAAGFPGTGAPIVRQLPNEAVTGALLLGGSQTTLLTDPDAGLLLLDVIAPATHAPRKALDVFARRLGAREVRSEERARG
jgi:S-adenosylmethionine/arginine decarboxylase-like enzyme